MNNGQTTKAVSRAVKTLENMEVPKKIDAAQVEAFRKEAMKTYTVADAMIVRDKETKLTAESFSKACSEFLKRVKEHFKPELDRRTEEKRQATADKKELDDLMDALAGLVKEAMTMADRKTRDYIAAENRRIEDENRKRQLEAQKKAEEEQKAKIAELKEIGTPEAKQAAKELKAAPVVAEANLEQAIESSAGIVHREAWTCEMDPNAGFLQLLQLVLAVAQKPELIIYIEPNWPALNAEARKSKSAFNVPGFRAVNKGATAHRN